MFTKDTTIRNVRIAAGVLFLASVAAGILITPLLMLAAPILAGVAFPPKYGPELALEGWRLDEDLSADGKGGAKENVYEFARKSRTNRKAS